MTGASWPLIRRVLGNVAGPLPRSRISAPQAAHQSRASFHSFNAIAHVRERDHERHRFYRGQIKAEAEVKHLGLPQNSMHQNPADKVAREIGIPTIGFTGAAGTQMLPLCDLCLTAPSKETPQIQQVHIVAAHAIGGLVERDLFVTVARLDLRLRATPAWFISPVKDFPAHHNHGMWQ